MKTVKKLITTKELKILLIKVEVRSPKNES